MSKAKTMIDASVPEAVAVQARKAGPTPRKAPADLYTERIQIGLTADQFRDLSVLGAYFGVPVSRIGRDLILRYLSDNSEILDALATGRGASYAESLGDARCTSELSTASPTISKRTAWIWPWPGASSCLRPNAMRCASASTTPTNPDSRASQSTTSAGAPWPSGAPTGATCPIFWRASDGLG